MGAGFFTTGSGVFYKFDWEWDFSHRTSAKRTSAKIITNFIKNAKKLFFVIEKMKKTLKKKDKKKPQLPSSAGHQHSPGGTDRRSRRRCRASPGKGF